MFKDIHQLFHYEILKNAEDRLAEAENRRYIVDPVAGVINNISNVVTDILDGGSRKRKSFRLSKKKSKVRSKRTLSKRSRTRKARKSM
jgi:hypothetical protein